MPSQNTFVRPSFWFGPAYVWFMLFRAHSRPPSDWACLGSPWKIYVRKFHADGIRWFNTLDNLKQFIVEPLAPCACLQRPGRKQTNMASSMGGGELSREWGKGRGRTKVVFLLFYFIALTSLNMFSCLVRPTCFFSLISCATSSRRMLPEGRGQGWWRVLDVAWWVIPRNWCVFWGHKNYKNFFRLFGLIVCDWESGSTVPSPRSPVPGAWSQVL